MQVSRNLMPVQVLLWSLIHALPHVQLVMMLSLLRLSQHPYNLSLWRHQLLLLEDGSSSLMRTMQSLYSVCPAAVCAGPSSTGLTCCTGPPLWSGRGTMRGSQSTAQKQGLLQCNCFAQGVLL